MNIMKAGDQPQIQEEDMAVPKTITILLFASLVWPILLVPDGAKAQTLRVEAPPHYCNLLSGRGSGRACSAPYRPHQGSPCGVFSSVRDKVSGGLAVRSGSCDASSVNELKRDTLKLRVELMRNVSAGFNEGQNDPVANPNFSPDPSTSYFYKAARYFQVECAIRTCAQGGSGASAPPAPTPPQESILEPPKPPAPPPYPEPAKPLEPKEVRRYGFFVCNNTKHRNLYIAVAADKKKTSRKFFVHYWTIIPKFDGRCTFVRGGRWHPGKMIYWNSHIRVGKSKPVVSFCVSNKGGSRYQLPNKTCRSGERSVGFTSWALDPGANYLNIDR